MVVVALALVAAALYVWAERGSAPSRRSAWFLGGLTVVVVALTGPIEQASHSLFWPHMIQHVLLVSVAAPMFVMAAAWIVPLKLLPPTARPRVVRAWRRGQAAAPVRRGASWLALPVVAWVVFDVVLLAWHVPAAFDLTLRSPVWHDIEHLLFLGTAVLFWLPVLDGPGHRARIEGPARMTYLVAASAVGWLLAVVLTLAPAAFYGYEGSGALSALADQRIAGGIMLVPGSLALLAVLAVAANRWLGDEDAVEAVT